MQKKKNTQKSYFASSGVHAPVQIENGRFFMKLNKSVKTNLTSETLKPAGIKTERKNEDDLTEENEIFL